VTEYPAIPKVTFLALRIEEASSLKCAQFYYNNNNNNNDNNNNNNNNQ
jgi:hypothetical protein